MGAFCGLVRKELAKMRIDNIEDRGSVLVVDIAETKTGTSKSFTIVKEDSIGASNLVR